MTTHTTFETSRLLAETGFPQPTPEFGQVWVEEDCTFIIARVGSLHEKRHFLFFGASHQIKIVMPLFFKDSTFAIIPNIQINLTGFQTKWEWKNIEIEYYVQWGFWGFCTKQDW